jgi:hypothetical protein
MRQTQENLEGAVRQFKALAEGLTLDSKLISESELAVMESFSAIGGVSSGVAARPVKKSDPAKV